MWGVLLWVALACRGITSAPASSEGEIRMERSDGRATVYSGILFIYHAGRWGAICDDGWTLESAHVVCRMLGFTRALGHTKYSYFGMTPARDGDTVDFWLDDVRCYGDETSVLDCVHADWGVHNCHRREMAGVYCAPTRISNEVAPAEVPRVPAAVPIPPSTTTRRPTTTTTRPTTTTTTTPRPTTTTTTPQLPTTPTGLDRIRLGHTMSWVLVPNRPSPTGQTYRWERRPVYTSGSRNRGNDILNNPPLVYSPRDIAPAEQPTDPPTPGPDRRLQTPAQERRPQVPDPPRAPVNEIPVNDAPASGNAIPDDNSIPQFSPPQKHPGAKIKYTMELLDGRNENEGRVEITLPGGEVGVICSDEWSLSEALVACRSVGRHYARSAVQANFFGGENQMKLASGIRCTGEETHLSECYHEQLQIAHATCASRNHVAGVICTETLPDLVPNATLVQESSYLQDRQMYYLQCAMEEQCASASAYEIKSSTPNWQHHSRRLLRFSSSTWNIGTADFHPFRDRTDWEWHLCHMHYHSMEVFAHYDILDLEGNRVAQGHKASFCLEDVQCKPGVSKQYRCQGYGQQGISVGCADDYLHDIDCQWIDISDLNPGNYIFQIHINPEKKVPEPRYDNNAVTCQLSYNQATVTVRDCRLGGV